MRLIFGAIHDQPAHTLLARALTKLEVPKNTLWVKLVKVESAREIYQRGLGAHPKQRETSPCPLILGLELFSVVSHGGLPDVVALYEPISKAWSALGIAPSTYTLGMLSLIIPLRMTDQPPIHRSPGFCISCTMLVRSC